LFLLGGPRSVGATLLLGGGLRGGWHSGWVTLDCTARRAHRCGHHR
jgi:hypothetical protein